jgi:hypothetical protein
MQRTSRGCPDRQAGPKAFENSLGDLVNLVKPPMGSPNAVL